MSEEAVDPSVEHTAKVVEAPVLTPREAYNAGRAAAQKQHTYRYNTDRDEATCSCGETMPASLITMHVEGHAEEAGRAARELALAAAVAKHEAEKK
jgi:hypothetical protein